MLRMLMALVVAVLFGLLFVFCGLRRIVQMHREPKPIKADFWGGVGVLIGIGFIAAPIWFVFDPDDPKDQPSKIPPTALSPDVAPTPTIGTTRPDHGHPYLHVDR